MTPELTDGERDLLYAIVDRGDGEDDLPPASDEAKRKLANMKLVYDEGRFYRPTATGCLVADLLRQVAAADDGMCLVPHGIRPHPAVYVPDDPAVIVGVLGKDCPDGWEWRSGTYSRTWADADLARDSFPNDLGMIRPAPRPDVVVSIPAELADELLTTYSHETEVAAAANLARHVAPIVRAARDEVS